MAGMDRYGRMHPVTEGEWVRDGRCGGRPSYRHVSGVVIRYRCNDWVWEIVGGPNDGLRFERLWAAQERAVA